MMETTRRLPYRTVDAATQYSQRGSRRRCTAVATAKVGPVQEFRSPGTSRSIIGGSKNHTIVVSEDLPLRLPALNV